jgi:hypothetical protein
LAGTIAFAPWLIRTWAWAGNPVFPEATRILGRGPSSEVQQERWERAHSPRPELRSVGARLLTATREIGLNWRFGVLVLPLGVAGALLALRRPEARFLLALFALLLLIFIGFTHLQGRFFVLGVPIAALMLALPARALWRWITYASLVAVATVSYCGVPATLATDARLAPYLESAGLAPRLNRYLHGPAARLVGLDDYRGLLPPVVDEALERTEPVALIGNAAAFEYQLPMSRLVYRTVFDLDVSGDDLVGAYLRAVPAADRGRFRLVVDPSELQRLSATYYGIPAPPAEWIARGRTFILPPGK